MSQRPDQRVGVLGLGIIGSRAAANLVAAGWNVACWNRSPKGLANEVARPEEAVKGAAVISVYLKDSPTVRSVFGRIEACLEGGQIILNHATLDLETTRWLHELCTKRGCRFLDAPFTGSKLAAEKGELFYYIGGSPELLDEVRELLGVTSRALLFCGDVGAATVVKLATNLISACTVQALAEALGIVTSQGISAATFASAVVENASASVLTAMKLPRMVAGDYDPHFSMSNMAKDSRYMVALAESAGLQVPAIEAVSERMESLVEEGLGDLDFSAVAQPYLQNP